MTKLVLRKMCRRVPVLLLLLILFYACEKDGGVIVETSVDFVFDRDSMPNPATVTFLNKSKFANGFVWYFGDGDSSVSVHPVHTYLNPGAYNVTLKAYTDKGIKRLTKVLHVLPGNVPYANFSITCDKPFQRVADATFTNQSVNCNSYKWDFEYNGTSFNQMSTDVHPAHSFINAGLYTIKLKAYGSNGDSSEISKTLLVKTEPDSLIITEIRIVTTTTLYAQQWPLDDVDTTAPDYYIAVGNWKDTSKKRSYIIMNSAAFPLDYDLSHRPIAVPVPPVSGSVPLMTPFEIWDWDGPGSDWVDNFPGFDIRQYMISPYNYPSQITLNNSYLAESEVIIKVQWK